MFIIARFPVLFLRVWISYEFSSLAVEVSNICISSVILIYAVTQIKAQRACTCVLNITSAPVKYNPGQRDPFLIKTSRTRKQQEFLFLTTIFRKNRGKLWKLTNCKALLIPHSHLYTTNRNIFTLKNDFFLTLVASHIMGSWKELQRRSWKLR